MLVLVIAPFFTSFLLRTLSWQPDPVRLGMGDRASCRPSRVLPEDGRLLATPFAVIAGLIYNFLPFMTLPLYASLDKVDYRLIEAAGDLYSSPFTGFRKVTFPLSLPGVVSGTLLTFIPGERRLHQRGVAGDAQAVHGREPDPVGVPDRAQLPARRDLSIILMVIVVLMVVVYVRRAGTRSWSDGHDDDRAPPGRDLHHLEASQPRRWLSDHLVLSFGIVVLIYTFVPIGYIIALSFNQPWGAPRPRSSSRFTWNNWTTICEPAGLCESLESQLRGQPHGDHPRDGARAP